MSKHPLAKLDHRYLWHPFTQMRDWLKREPIVIESGSGATLRDVNGKEYLDANSSIWTNLHGHQHPKINAAIQRQLGKIAHSSALGLASEPASLLAAQLINAANVKASQSFPIQPAAKLAKPGIQSGDSNLAKVFFSDDG
jgi:adenosylmethionine-8-amino-7-oxononanoate aminotransferase